MGVDTAENWRAATELLGDRHARVGAAEDRGLLVPLPPEAAVLVPSALEQNRVLVGRTALDAVRVEDHTALIDAWDRNVRTGRSSVPVCLADAPDSGTWMMHFFDVRERIGVHLVVCVPTDEVRRPDATLPPRERARPRFARMRKDQLGIITEIDEATTQLLGWTPEEVLGRRSSELIHPDDRDLAIASWLEMLGTPGLGRRTRLRHARRDGSWAWVEITNQNALADSGHVFAEVVDISDEMAAHEALRAREQLLHRLAEALPVAVVQTDADGAVLYANGRTADLFGAEATHVEDLLAAVAETDRDGIRGVFGRVLSGADGATVEIALANGRTHLSVVVRRLDEGGSTTGAVACFTDVTDSLRLRHELQQRAEVDPLTGSLNRSAVLDRLHHAVDAGGPGVAVVFVDLDGFKAVNDEQGHETGDEVLVRVAGVLRDGCREEDHVGRYGGDEFLVTCGNVDSPQEARAVAQRFATALAEHDLHASVGVAWSRPGGTTVRQLVAAADTAMYAAKATRNGEVVLAS